MYVKNNLGPSSSNGLSADVPCSTDTSVEWQAKNFPVKGLNGGCQKDLGNENNEKHRKANHENNQGQRNPKKKDKDDCCTRSTQVLFN